MTPNNMSALFQAAVSAVTKEIRGDPTVGTSKEREQKSEAAKVAIRFQLLFTSMAAGKTKQILIGIVRLWQEQRAVSISMATLLASVIRYIGGPHIGAHRDMPTILKHLAGKIDDDIHRDLTRIFTSGSPSLCNAEFTEENFQKFVNYGNHKSSMEADLDATRKSLLKESKRGYVLLSCGPENPPVPSPRPCHAKRDHRRRPPIQEPLRHLR